MRFDVMGFLEVKAMDTTINDYFDPETSPPELLIKIAYAFDQQDTMAGVTDLEGNVAFANQSALRNVGATLEEVKGAPFSESPWRRHSQQAKSITKEMLSKALNGERSIVEDNIVNSEGKEIPTIFSISPIYDSAGKLVGMLPEGKIISDLKILQKRLENERWVTRQWLDSMGALVAKCDQEGRVFACNRSTTESLGMEFEAIKGERIWNLRWFGHSKEGQNRIREAILTARHGKKSSVEVVITLANDISKPFLFSTTPIMDAEDHISFLALEAMDISGQVTFRELMVKKEREYSRRLKREIDEATRELRESEQFNKNLVDSAPMGIIQIDQDGKVVFINPEIEKKLAAAGIKRNKIRGKKLSELNIYPADDSWERIRKLHLDERHRFRHARLILRCNENENLLFEVNTAPLKGYVKEEEGSIVLMNDVTKRARLKAELFQARMQSEKLTSLGQLISGVAHEINNPLTSVIGCSEYLMEDCSLDEKSREAVEIIVSEAKRSGRIVLNLLTFARQSAPEKRISDFNDIITAVLGICMYGLKDKGITVALDLDDQLPQISIDENQIQQVILNLLNNAVDAMADSVHDDCIIIRTYEKGHYVIMEIEDNGSGIPEAVKQKIFDPFFTTKEAGKGTGLGLSISYGIIQEHGGTIEAESVDSGGTRFTVCLPTSISVHPQVVRTTSIEKIPSCVLVVDDEKNIRLSLSNHLKSLGILVDEASNGIEALAKIRMEAYDLLLVDLKMPEMGGMELYGELELTHRDLAGRFVIMTGAQGKDIVDFLEKTDNPVLPKPFDRKDVLRVLSWFSERFGTQRQS